MMEAAFNRLAVRFALIVVAALLGLCGTGFLLVAIYLGIAEELGRPLAAFLTGVIALLGSGAVVLALRFGRVGEAGKKARMAAVKSEPTDSEVTAMASAMGAELGTWIKGNSRTAVVGAFLAGTVLGASPQARAGLRDLVKTVARGRNPSS